MQTKSTNTTRRHDPKKWVAYYRTSTRRQNLGLDAQRAAITAAAKEAGATIVAEYQEQESGRNTSRAALGQAVADTLTRRAVLVVAKHDRLSRNIAFASQIIFTRRVPVKILNFPDDATTDPLFFGIYFGLAQKEAEMISQRTRAALAAKKAQGAKLGRPDAATSITDQMRANSIAARRAAADNDPANLLAAATIRQYLATATDRKQRTLQAIADHLNARGVYTATGCQHSRRSVDTLCSRYNIDRLAV